jgi:hypothetical protein
LPGRVGASRWSPCAVCATPPLLLGQDPPLGAGLDVCAAAHLQDGQGQPRRLVHRRKTRAPPFPRSRTLTLANRLGSVLESRVEFKPQQLEDAAAQAQAPSQGEPEPKRAKPAKPTKPLKLEDKPTVGRPLYFTILKCERATTRRPSPLWLLTLRCAVVAGLRKRRLRPCARC